MMYNPNYDTQNYLFEVEYCYFIPTHQEYLIIQWQKDGLTYQFKCNCKVASLQNKYVVTMVYFSPPWNGTLSIRVPQKCQLPKSYKTRMTTSIKRMKR